MTDWKTIESAPWGKVVEVKNDLMRRPVKATRGFAQNGVVNENHDLFTSVYTPDPDGFFPTPSGELICPNVWREIEGEGQ